MIITPSDGDTPSVELRLLIAKRLSMKDALVQKKNYFDQLWVETPFLQNNGKNVLHPLLQQKLIFRIKSKSNRLRINIYA